MSTGDNICGWYTVPCFCCCNLSGDCQVMQMPKGLFSDITICGYEIHTSVSAIKAHPFILLTTFSFCTKFAPHQRLVTRNYEFSEMGSVDSLGL